MALDLGTLAVTLEADDQMSRVLLDVDRKMTAVQQSADRTRAALSGSADKSADALKKTGKAARDAGDDAEESAKDHEKLGDTLGRKLPAGADKGAKGFGDLAVKLGLLGAAYKVVDWGKDAIGFGISTAMANEQAEISFTTMLGSAEKAGAFIKDLQAFAAKTPFEFAGLQQSASSLISIGIDANKVVPIMTTLGNVTSGMGTGAEGIQRATVALQQMNAAGKISGEDLAQLRDAGVPVFDLLTAATGKTTAEIADMAQKGKLGKQELEQLMAALESGKGMERFAGLMDKQSESLEGLLSSFKDTFGIEMGNAMAPVIPLLKDGLAGATQILADVLPKVVTGLAAVVEWLVNFGGWVQRNQGWLLALAGAVGVTIGVLQTFLLIGKAVAAVQMAGGMLAFVKSLSLVRTATTMAAGAQWLFNTALFASPITWIVLGIIALVAAIVYAWKNVDGFREGVTGAFNAVWGVVKAVADWFVNTLVPWFAGVWAAIVAGAQGLWAGITGVFGAIVGWFAGVWDTIAAGAQAVWAGITGVFQAVSDWVVNVFMAGWALIEQYLIAPLQAAWGAIVAVWDAISGFLATWGGWIGSVFKAAWDILYVVIMTPVLLAQMALQAAWDFIKTVFSAAWEWVSGVFGALWAGFVGIITPPLDRVRQFVTDFWNATKALFSAFWDWVSGVFRGLWNGFVELITSVLDWVKRNVDAFWSAVTAAFTAFWNWVSGTFRGWWNTFVGLITSVLDWVKRNVDAFWAGVTRAFSAFWAWVSGTFTGLWNGLVGLLTGPIERAREVLSGVLDRIREGFRAAVDFIGQHWGTLEAIIKAPVRIAIDAINGLISAFRTVGKFVGIADEKLPNKLDYPPGFKRGGYTGDGNPNDVAGVVHRREQVIPAGSRSRAERMIPGGLDYLTRTGNWPVMGGRTWPTTIRTLSGNYSGHSGIDIPVGIGTPLYAADDGTITYSGWGRGYGNAVFMRFADGYQGVYGHTSTGSLLPVGTQVKAGTLIARSGNTGRSSGPHLHFEVTPTGSFALAGNRGITQGWLAGSAVPAASAAGEDGGGAGFDPLGMLRDLAGKAMGPLKGLGDSPYLQFFKNVPAKILDAMVEKITGLAGRVMDWGANVGATVMNALTLLPQMFQIAQDWGLERRVAEIMGITMLQEASGRTDFTPDENSDVGIFQQRTPRDGTIAQLNNLEYAMRVFLYGTTARAGNGDSGGYHVPGLFDKNWRSMSPGQAAQAVQVSAYPSAYDKHIPRVGHMLDAFEYDRGGVLQPGSTLVQNNTGRPEAVLTQPQWQALAKLGSALAAGRLTPSVLEVRDVDGALVGRMQVEAESALADSYARVGGR